jgi:hypothetical protein
MFQKIMTEKNSNLIKAINPQIEDTQNTPGRRNIKKKLYQGTSE